MSSLSKQRILIIGAGAIGGYVGGSLLLAGHSVVFLATPPTRRILESEGLHLALPDSAHHLHPQAYDTTTDAFRPGGFDLVVFAVKRYDTRAAAEPLQGYRAQIGALLNLQNGIGAEEDLLELLPGTAILPGTVTTAVGRPARNHIVVERLRGIGVAGGAAAELLCPTLNAAGLQAQYFRDPGEMKWSKLITNLAANPTAAILDMAPSAILDHAGLFRLEMLQLREALAVMQALQLKVVDLPGTPVRLLAFCARRLPLPLAHRLLGPALGRGRGDKMPSFHGDLHGGGGRSEIDFYHGAVAAYGQRLGVPTPVNAFLVDILHALMQGRLPEGHYRSQPEQLLHDLEVRLESG